MDINEKDSYDRYPLFMAIQKNNIEIVKIIFQYAYQKKILLNISENDSS